MSGGWLRLGSAFGIGLAVSLWLYPVVAGPTVQRLRLERDQAQTRLEALQTEVDQLRAQQQKQPAPCTIRRVVVEIDGADQRVSLEVGRRLQKELAPRFTGRQAEAVSFLLLYGEYQGRQLEVDGLRYQLEVRAVVIGPELALYGWLQPMASR